MSRHFSNFIRILGLIQPFLTYNSGWILQLLLFLFLVRFMALMTPRP
jgi:hypothetical protein